ncbi:MAG: hypothetical protein ACLFWM_06040 [Actinomycetota bacterium]
MIPGFLDALWGFCPACEHWHCSTDWHAGGRAACPHCGEAPAVVESVTEGTRRMRLDLEVATGPVGRRRFFD